MWELSGLETRIEPLELEVGWHEEIDELGICFVPAPQA